MAVGDVVSAIVGAAATQNFQPAAGVEAVITSFGDTTAAGFQASLTDGTELSLSTQTISGVKMFMTNSVFLEVSVSGTTDLSFSGIETK